MALLFIEKYKGDKKAFSEKVIAISKLLKIDPNWLMFVMNLESKVNPQAQNTVHLVAGQPATGLIQFVKPTAISLGTSIEALYKMDGVQQLDYVYKYLKPLTGKIKSVYDMYLAVFFPIAIGKPNDFIFKTKTVSADTIAKANPIFDYYKKNIITLDSFKRAVFARIPEAHKLALFGPTQGGNNIIPKVLAIVAIVAISLYFKYQN